MFNENFEDMQLPCSDCGQSFVFSAEDQEFYQQRGFSSPKRCPICRANRKMSDNRGGSRGGGGNRSRGGGGGAGFNRPQYKVICSSCGVETTVPFEPRNDRPVFCADCYRNQR
jgi:CxxC-x17-CxxC domain-containing protein